MGRKYFENHLKTINTNLDYLEDIPFIKFQSKIFRDERVISFYRQQACMKKFREISGFKKKVELNGVLSVIKQIFNSFLIIPVRRKRVKGKVLKELVWGFSSKNLVDDYLVDNKTVKKEDMVYYKTEKNDTGRRNAYIEAEKKGLKIINQGRFINLNKIFFYHIWFNFLCGIVSFLNCLIHSPELLPLLSAFLGRSNFFFRLFSFADVELFLGTDNRNGVVQTVVANKCGIHTFIYPWSDLSVYPSCEKQDIGYNDLFIWGKGVLDLNFKKNCCDNIYVVGCRFSNSYKKKSKADLRKQLDLPINKKIVTFYDTSYSKKSTYTEKEYKDFIETVSCYAQKNPDVYVILKPKHRPAEKYQEILKKSNVKILNKLNVFISDILCLSDVNVGMGINTTITIGLLCGIPSLNYDKTNNKFHPITKNKQITFDDKKKLFKQINKLLKEGMKKIEIKELEESNVKNADTMKILRKYIMKRDVDKKFLYKG